MNSQSFFKVASDQKLAPEDEEATSGLRVEIKDSQRNLWEAIKRGFLLTKL